MKRFPNFALSSYLGWDEKKGWKFSDKDFVFSSEQIYICDIFRWMINGNFESAGVLIFSKREASDVENLSFSFSPFFFFPRSARNKMSILVRSKAWKLFRFVAESNVMHFIRPHFWMNRNQFYTARHTGIVPH